MSFESVLLQAQSNKAVHIFLQIFTLKSRKTLDSVRKSVCKVSGLMLHKYLQWYILLFFHLQKSILQLYSFFCFTVLFAGLSKSTSSTRDNIFLFVILSLLSGFTRPCVCVCSICFIPPAWKSEKFKWLKTVHLKCNNHIRKLDL